MTSLWLDRELSLTNDPFPDDDTFEDLVVGGGLTGLTTALLLARAGRRVGVVEARHVGAVTTGRTTGKVSLLQGAKLSRMLGYQSHHVAGAYVEANREGQAWLLQFCADHDVPAQIRDAVTYAATDGDVHAAREEHEAALSLGFPVRWVESLDVPFPNAGATVLADQAQVDPMDVLDALAAQFRSHGGTLHEGSRVVEVSRLGHPRATLEDGRVVHADNVILATGVPVLDRGLYFAKVEPKRSYVVVFDGVVPPPGMYLSVGSSTRSVREVPRDGRSLLMVGGSGHTVGRSRSEREHVDELRRWTAEHFPAADETHSWSAQDYSAPDGIPYVGKLPRGGGHVYVATGYDKWGLTNAVAAARNISADILGEQPGWARVLGHRITRPRGAASLALLNAGVGVAGARSLVGALARTVPPNPPEGEGAVGRSGALPVGTSTVDGQTCRLLAVCTHLGGTLHWNDAEKTWDCPLHGSRFAPDGSVLEGPATKPLARRDDV
jgi:glycine/D-amino acid oxidase-like deaminating enzyme/nitrite reductase/ring-hydroxylating ferredoxin subunit